MPGKDSLYIVANDEEGATLTANTFSNGQGFRVILANSYKQAAQFVAEEYNNDFGLDYGITLEVALVPAVKTFEAEAVGVQVTERTTA